MIVQIFRETRPTAATNILQDNIDQIDNDNTLRSMFSGDSFPTNPAPVVGQPCYRTDLNKLFIYTADGWVEIMGKPIYDPRSVSADAFHMDNMTEGANTKIMTAEERDKIIALENDVSKLNNRTWDVIIEDRKPPGHDGGTFSSGAWRRRDLTYIVYNNDDLSFLQNHQFTLPAGTYCIDWDAPANKVDRHQTRLVNVSIPAVVAYGTNEHASKGYDGHSRSWGTAIVTIDSPSKFEIQHRCETTYGPDGFGAQSLAYGDEIYTRVRIKKIN